MRILYPSLVGKCVFTFHLQSFWYCWLVHSFDVSGILAVFIYSNKMNPTKFSISFAVRTATIKPEVHIAGTSFATLGYTLFENVTPVLRIMERWFLSVTGSNVNGLQAFACRWTIRSQVWKSQLTNMTLHYNDIIMSAVASQITSISIVCSTVKENIKAPRHWPLCGEFTDDRWIPRTKDQ